MFGSEVASAGEAFGYSLQVMVIGMVIVFVGLIILIVLFSLMSALLKGTRKVKAEQPSPAASAPRPAPAPVVIARDESEDEIAAVIAAAIAAVAEGGQNGLVIRQIRRVGHNVPAWNTAGRVDIVNSRS